MKRKLFIISDMYGFQNADWLEQYKSSLDTYFPTTYLDSSKLAGIECQELNTDQLHSRFVHFGISQAVDKLKTLETGKVDILAFSIGGTIAWKAALGGLDVKRLFIVSATRLRYETEKPNCTIHLFYGEKDPYNPPNSWFKKNGLKPEIILEGGHEIYKNEAVINILCERLKSLA